MRDSTRVVRAGIPSPVQGAAILPGPTFAGTYHFSGEPSTSPYTYGRYHNPTWTGFESAIGGLEGGYAVVFASGMAAVTSVLSVTLQAEKGSHPVLVMPSDGYYTARMLANGPFARSGVEVRTAPTAGNAQREVLKDATLLWLESPSNPGLDVCDISDLVQLAHRQGTLVAVDNTTATFLGQRPLELGADFSVSSDTKSITGHDDLVLGHVAVREASWAEKLASFRTQQGAVPGPMEVWLAHRSLATLDLRLGKQCENALGIAKFLSGRSEVKSVRYPGLPQDRAHAVASRQMKRFGPIVSFDMGDRARAEKLLSACRLVLTATSFGGVYTTAERRARWGGDMVPEGMVRLSAGCEDLDDLIEDLASAFQVVQTRS